MPTNAPLLRAFSSLLHRRHSSSTHGSHYSPVYPRMIQLREMGPRDGLQSEKTLVSTSDKVAFINLLSQTTGLRYIEATSFVSPKAIPQLGDCAEVMAAVARPPGVHFSALVPNLKGFQQALAAGLGEVAVFTAASDAFSLKNINCNVLTSLERFAPVLAEAKAHGMRVRGYVSTALGCPYAGPVAPEAAAFIARRLLDAGCYEVSLGDTIGVGTPPAVRALLRATAAAGVPRAATALHFHATYGAAMANVCAAMEEGISIFDSSVAGLGGCNYARGASGNVATEDVLFLAAGMGVEVEGAPDINAVCAAGQWMCDRMGRRNASAVALARGGHAGAGAGAGAVGVGGESSSSSGSGNGGSTLLLTPRDIGLSWPVAWPGGDKFAFAPPASATAGSGAGAASAQPPSPASSPLNAPAAASSAVPGAALQNPVIPQQHRQSGPTLAALG